MLMAFLLSIQSRDGEAFRSLNLYSFICA